MNRWIGSWRMALRIARRQVPRHKGRNALIVAMLLLPVFAAVSVDTLLTSSLRPSALEQLTRKVGGFDAFVSYGDGAAIAQTPDGSNLTQAASAQVTVSPNGIYTVARPRVDASTAAQLARIDEVLPGATLTPENVAGSVYFEAASADAGGAYWQVNLADPATAGIFDLVSGRIPAAAHEIALSPVLAAELGVSVGQSVTLPASSAAAKQDVHFTVVGLIELPNSTKSEAAFTLPSAPGAAGESPNGWFVSGTTGVTWAQVLRLNQVGNAVTSRAVVLAPPPAAAVPYNQAVARFAMAPSASRQQALDQAAVAAIVLGVALLEIVLLAGPAFAVSARRREREYAMLGACGADQPQLRRIVLADGVVLGAVAGVLGVGLGCAAAAALMPFAADIDGRLPGAFHVNALHCLGVALPAVFLGLCSAYYPARGVARREIMATLAGRRVIVGRKRRVASVGWGLALAALGLLCEFFGRSISPDMASVLITGGVALIEVGAILCTSGIVAAVASFGRLLPLGPRLALRDSARHSARTTPAVAAMFAAVAGAVAAGAWLDSSAAQQRAQYTPVLLRNQAAIQADAKDFPRILSALRSEVPELTGSFTTQSVAGYQQSMDDGTLWSVSAIDAARDPQCPVDGVAQVSAAEAAMGCGDYFETTAIEGEAIGGPQTLREVTGVQDPAAEQVLSNGGIVVSLPGIVHDGKVTLMVQHSVAAPNAKLATQTTATYTVPAAFLDLQGKPDPGFVISPAAAARLGLNAPDHARSTLVLNLSEPLSLKQSRLVDATLQDLHVNADVQVDGGLTNTRSLVNLVVLAFTILLAIGAAAIATGLALADGRADQETLTAVGGSPWTRRWLSGSTALVITGLGVLIGVPVGFVIAAGLVRVSNIGVGMIGGYFPGETMPFTVPWLNLGAMAVAVPLITAAGAMALSRSRPPGRLRLE